MGMRLLLKSKCRVESTVAVSRAHQLSVSGCRVGACATMSSSEDFPACFGSRSSAFRDCGPNPCLAYWTGPI